MNESDRPAPSVVAWWPRGWRPRHVVVLCFAMAGGVGFIVQHVVPPPATDLALMCAVWVTFYPVARMKPGAPWWLHWVNGLGLLLGFLVVFKFFSG